MTAAEADDDAFITNEDVARNTGSSMGAGIVLISSRAKLPSDAPLAIAPSTYARF
jgi:hypothetical protein